MTRVPMILVSPSIEKKGEEFGDASISLSEAYQHALIGAGAVPVALPATVSRVCIAECVRRCDGVLLTGGDDVEPGIYSNGLPEKVRRTVRVTADGGRRDLREVILVDETLRQRKPLLGICRGHQMINVALGGTLLADIPNQVRGKMRHQRQDRRDDVVHDVRLTPGSMIGKIIGSQRLGVNSTHHQAIGRVAPGLRATAYSPDGVVEALELPPEATQDAPFLLTVQFHPERLVRRHTGHRAIFKAFVAACVERSKS